MCGSRVSLLREGNVTFRPFNGRTEIIGGNSLLRGGLAQARDSETGLVALLGMRSADEDGGNELRGGGGGFLRPADEPGG